MNFDNDDGCSSTCLVEEGWMCQKGHCTPICGDGEVLGDEACDDLLEGCDNETCQPLDGYTCSEDSNNCWEHCGDGEVQPHLGESCDFGTENGNVEGCNNCVAEPGYYCYCDQTECFTDCGDKIKAGDEACDGIFGCEDTCEPGEGFGCSSQWNECFELCGNGVVDPGEECDNENDPGCSEFCEIECGWDCPDNSCSPICGDGLTVGSEVGQCDHWGQTDMGCTETCEVQDGWYCTDNECITDCSDSIIAGDEECSQTAGFPNMDIACETDCTIKPNYACDDSLGNGLECRSLCGDGELGPGEQCDDGGNVDGDGCDSTCQFEAGFQCWFYNQAPAGFVEYMSSLGGTYFCGTECGDDIVAGDEFCEPSITGATCQDLSDPQPCQNKGTCSDNFILANEACDDGNTVSGDGCNDQCQVEAGWDCTNLASGDQDGIT